MSRLIAFSGGVESVALLGLARKGDRLLLIEQWAPGQLAYIEENIRRIVDYYGLPLERFSIGPLGIVNCQQMTLLLAVGTARACDDDNITEFWLGMHTGDVSGAQADRFKRLQDGWATLHPNKPLRMPLRHETKRQQWDRIPDELKPYVHTCVQREACGVCHKCQERTAAGIPI